MPFPARYTLPGLVLTALLPLGNPTTLPAQGAAQGATMLRRNRRWPKS